MWVFFSDVHLIESNSERGKKILSFLDRVKDQLDGLVIVGDLFDFWFGYRLVVFNQFFPILSKINQIRESGVRIIYIAGNHDFHFGPIFDEIIPIETHTAPCSLTLQDKKILLHHGDGIDNRDFRYNFFKKVIRSKITLSISELFHPNIGWRIAKALSRTSHHYFHKKETKERYLKACEKFTGEKYKEGYDVIIFGHLHEPHIKRTMVDNKERVFVILGDWINHDTFLQYEDDKGLALMHYDYNNDTIEKYKIE